MDPRPLKERKDRFLTLSGIELPRVVDPESLKEGILERVGFPGEYPYTRGIHPTLYRGRLWTMRQYAGYGTARETHERFLYLLSQGTTGLSVAFDLPTQLGMDSDDPQAQGEVGKVGVAISVLDDVDELFRGIPLGRVSTSMTINAPASILLSMYVAVAKSQGVEERELSGTIQNDILKEYIARGTYIFPPHPSLRLVVDTMEYSCRNLPRWNPISVSGYHIREAGATASQEIAFTLLNAETYLKAAIERGIDPDLLGPRISFFFCAQIDFLEEVAKFRAARRMWARIAREELGMVNPESWRMRFHTQTAGSSLAAQESENNIVRTTLEALAAVLGGTQSLHTNAHDEALGLPTEKSARIALRIQQVLAHESGVAHVVDPVGGAYAIEYLTDRLEEEAWRIVEKVRSMGGMLRAIESGWVLREIQESAYAFQKRVESGEFLWLGVNLHRPTDAEPYETLKVDPSLEEERRTFLQRVRSSRESRRVEEALESIRKAAQGEENLLPPILEAVQARATLGEICQSLRSVWGVYEPPRGI